MKLETLKLEKVTSTNDVVIDLIKKNNKSTGLVYANIQTLGRGTRGRKWISDEGNLFASLFFPLEKKFPSFAEFSVINPVIISEVITNICEAKNITLKFPNDIFLNGKKVCGVLQELVTVNKKKFLIIGIGLNIISNPKINNIYKATNIFKETKKKLRISMITKRLIFSYEKFFKNLASYKYVTFKSKMNLLTLN